MRTLVLYRCGYRGCGREIGKLVEQDDGTMVSVPLDVLVSREAGVKKQERWEPRPYELPEGGSVFACRRHGVRFPLDFDEPTAEQVAIREALASRRMRTIFCTGGAVGSYARPDPD